MMKIDILDFRRWTYMRYLGASVAALVADMAVFLVALNWMAAALASAAGYMFGILVHWLISSRMVFAQHAATVSQERYRQKALFLVSALVGLTLTVGIVGLADMAGIDARLAKLAAIAVSFQTTYYLRKRIVFRP